MAENKGNSVLEGCFFEKNLVARYVKNNFENL